MQATLSPKSPPRSRLPAAERRKAILDAALGLFAERDYETISMAAIATTSGVTKPVLYDHFASKQQLYVALVEREAAARAAALAPSVDSEAPLEERFRSLASSAIKYARRHPRSSRLLLQMPNGDPVVREAHEAVRARRRERIATAILADPEFRASPGLSRRASAELLADLHGTVLERIVHWALDRPSLSAATLSGVFVDVLL